MSKARFIYISLLSKANIIYLVVPNIKIQVYLSLFLYCIISIQMNIYAVVEKQQTKEDWYVQIVDTDLQPNILCLVFPSVE